MQLGISLEKKQIIFVLLGNSPLVKLLAEKINYPKELDYKNLVKILLDKIEKIKTDYPKQSITVGISYFEGFSDFLKNNYNLHYESILEQLQKDLETHLSSKVNLIIDASAISLASNYLEFPKANTLAVFNLDDDLELSIIKDKKVIARKNKPNKIAHLSFNPAGIKCDCGRIGCLKQYLSSLAINNFTAELAKSQSNEVKSFNPIQQIYQQSLSGNEKAKKFIEDYLMYFGLAMASIINTYDPDIICLRGKWAQFKILYSSGLTKIYDNFKNNPIDTKIALSELDSTAAAYGAAYSAINLA